MSGRSAALARPLVVLALVAAAYLSGAAGLLWWSTAPMVVGWQPTVVLTGSMAPALHPGDVVLVGPVGEDETPVPTNRIVLVADDSRDTGTYLHRVVAHDDDGRLVTQGDANASADPGPVTAERVRGQVRLVVPTVGLPTVWLHRGEYVPVVAATLVTWAAVVLTGHAVRWARGDRRSGGRHRTRAGVTARLAGPAATSVALALVVTTVAAPLATLTVAPFTGTWVSEGNRISTGSWTPSNLRWWGAGGAGQAGLESPSAAFALRTVPAPGGTSGWKQVAAGASHACAIASDDTLWCWGENGAGQLGLGGTTSTAAPTQVTVGGVAVTWSSVDTEADHTCGVRPGGEVWCWGANDYGQLGDGSTTPSSTPVRAGAAVGAFAALTAVAVGEKHSCAIASAVTDALFCWGMEPDSQASQTSPTQITVGNAVWGQISAGGRHTCAVRSNATNTLYCWGRNSHGQTLTDPATTGLYVTFPQIVTTGVTSVVAGATHTCAVVSGQVRCGGSGEQGQLTAGRADSHTLATVGASSSWQAVGPTGSGSTVCARNASAEVWCWGDNDHGQITDGSAEDVSTPVRVAGLWRAVSAGGDRVCLIAVGAGDSGAMSCSGSNHPGTPSVRSLVPTTVGVLAWSAVAVGKVSSCGVTTDGALWCWGSNRRGQLGQGDTSDRVSPTRVGAVTTWRSVAVGNGHACATRQDDSLWCWGRNTDGQLGVGDTTQRTSPVQVAGSWSSVVASATHTCALATTGALSCWGENAVGQLGVGDTVDRTAPAQVSAGTTWRSVGTGAWHTCAVRTDGQIWCWGTGGSGQLFTPYASRLAPAQLSGDTAWREVVVGDQHACVTRSDGTVSCWGGNEHAQLGRGTTGGQGLLAQVSSLTGVSRLTAGARHTCALRTDGTAACWGDNTLGQLGTGTTTQATVPSTVPGLTGLTVLAAGQDTTVALRTTQASAYRAAVAADSPSGYWRLDETSGTTAAASTGAPAGTFLGGPELGAVGAMAGSRGVALDGVDDAVSWGDTFDFAGTTAFTVETWVRRTATSGYPRVVAKADFADQLNPQGWDVLVDGSTGAVLFSRHGTGGTSQVVSSSPVGVGTWHHVVATYDGATMRLYLDGQPVGSAASGVVLADHAVPVHLGSLEGFDWLAGGVDEVALYTGTAVSAARVLAHYEAATG